MNAHLKSDLIKDHILDVSRGRRRKRTTRGVLAIMLPLCAAVFAMWPSPDPMIISGKAPVVEEPEPFVTLSTDDELLDSLAHLGPVLVTHEDGSQWLYLTNE